MFIDVDLDGVLGTSLEFILSEMRKEYSEDGVYSKFHFKDIVSYDFKGVREDVKRYIWNGFKNPDIMQHFEFYPYAKELLKLLVEWGKSKGYKVRIYTLVFNEESCAKRKEYLLDWLFENDLQDVKVKVDVGTKKTSDKVTVFVEDCLQNLLNSNAKYKILLNQPYNKGLDTKNLKEQYQIYKVSLNTVIQDIKGVLKD